ncbi:MAG TPA: hypothetical protein VMM57_00120 [Bacteroidota bacterium]|nr:hypothetical protein [Bacteroidota bacterium]
MKKAAALLFVPLLLIGDGCSRRSNAPPITGWQQFQDPYFRVTFSYPKDWYVQTEPNKVTITTTQDALQKFFDPYSKNPIGAQILVVAEKFDSLQDVAKFMSSYRADLSASGYELKPDEQKQIDGNPAIQVSYAGRLDENTKIAGIRIATLKDSTIYYVHYSAFNELYEPYKVAFDSVLASIALPKAKVVAKNVDPSLPVDEMDKFSNDVLEIMYPANFGPTLNQPKGDVQFSMQIKGYRQDCTIDIDVRPAKKLTLEKVMNQNSKLIKSTSNGTTTIGGEKANYLNYSPMKNIDSRIYFIVKNDKIYRIIWNYYDPMKKSFQPAFEKTVASLRIK